MKLIKNNMFRKTVFVSIQIKGCGVGEHSSKVCGQRTEQRKGGTV